MTRGLVLVSEIHAHIQNGSVLYNVGSVPTTSGRSVALVALPVRCDTGGDLGLGL